MFEVAEAYDAMMGRSSRQLSATLARVTGGEDRRHRSFQGFVEYARTNVTDPRVIFEIGDAQDLLCRRVVRSMHGIAHC
jgi:hypothetical protein